MATVQRLPALEGRALIMGRMGAYAVEKALERAMLYIEDRDAFEDKYGGPEFPESSGCIEGWRERELLEPARAALATPILYPRDLGDWSQGELLILFYMLMDWASEVTRRGGPSKQWDEYWHAACTIQELAFWY